MAAVLFLGAILASDRAAAQSVEHCQDAVTSLFSSQDTANAIEAARTLASCRTRSSDDRRLEDEALLSRLFDPEPTVREAVREALVARGIVTRETLAILPDVAEIERLASAAVHAHDRNESDAAADMWRHDHRCVGTRVRNRFIVRCGASRDECNGYESRFDVDFRVGPRGLGPPRVHTQRTPTGGSCGSLGM